MLLSISLCFVSGAIIAVVEDIGSIVVVAWPLTGNFPISFSYFLTVVLLAMHMHGKAKPHMELAITVFLSSFSIVA